MTLDWTTLANKINDRNLRERGLIFLMVVSVLVAIIFTLFLEPHLAKQKTLSQQMTQQQDQIKGIQAQLQALEEARSVDPDTTNRAKLESLRIQLVQIKALLQVKQQHLIPADKIAGLLEDMLSRNRQLQLISLLSLPASIVTGEEEQATAIEKEFFKHGVEISVRGNYFDLLNYVVQLEKLPSQMFWGKASLTVEQYPVSRLTLTLFTLSLDKAWLVI
ncbi:MAG: type II secretion system protein GspM [Burkholderiales bacterium]